MRSAATTVEAYIEELPSERRRAIETVRAKILQRLPKGFEEGMSWGMIAYQVPLSVYPDTYNGKPLMYAALASQKNYMALYLTPIYTSEDRRKEFERAFSAAGKKLDAGKSCLRFKKLEDLPLEVIGDSIASMTMEQFVDEVKTAGSVRKS